MSKIAWLGLGAMGQRIAMRMLQAGHDLVVYNRSLGPEQAFQSLGARVAKTPAEAVVHADIVFAMLSDEQASRDVWLAEQTGAIPALDKDTVVVEASTLPLAWTGELAQAVHAMRAHFVAAPVLGSLPQAEAGTLHCFVGSDSDVIPRIMPAINCFSGIVHNMDSPASAMAIKLCVNAWLAIQVASVSEVISLAERLGFTKKQATAISSVPTFRSSSGVTH